MLNFYRLIALYLVCTLSHAAPNATELSVWANEAIVATYTFDYKNFMTQQQGIAHYFTANGWNNYSTALIKSNLPNTIKKNDYFVSAVATLPPTITEMKPNQWKAVMPLLVIYKNPQYQQKQSLEVTIIFVTTPSNGIRGLAIDSINAVIIDPPCECQAPSTKQQD